MNIRVGKISTWLFPQFSSCGKCKTTWNFVEHHTTMYTKYRGMFPLCEKCWSELTPEGRLPFYKDLWDSWTTEVRDATWGDVEVAVLRGL